VAIAAADLVQLNDLALGSQPCGVAKCKGSGESDGDNDLPLLPGEAR